MRKCDVAIIGAGPSGCITAMLCAKAGIDTLLIEKKALPRFKVCGGGLTIKSINILRDINCFDEKSIDRFCYSVQVHLPKSGEKFIINSGHEYMAIVERSTFDKYLANQAEKSGVILKEGERFIEYRVNASGNIEVITDKEIIVTDILVGADGVQSSVRKQLQMEYPSFFPPRDFLMGINAEIPKHVLDKLSDHYAHLFFGFSNAIDYAWAFPKKQSFNIGLGFKPNKKSPINVKNFFMSFINDTAGKECRQFEIKAGLLPVFWSRMRSAVQWGHIILIGDAAGFVDEWTGEGLYYSIKSSLFAHKSIEQYLNNRRNDKALLKYTSLCSKDFYNNLLFSHFFAKLFRKHPYRYNYLRNSYLRNLFVPFSTGKLNYFHAFMKTAPRIFPGFLRRKAIRVFRKGIKVLLKKDKRL